MLRTINRSFVFTAFILLLFALPAHAQTRLLCASKSGFTDSKGNAWSADSGAQFTAGANDGSYANAHWIPIAGTPDQPIYQSQRWGSGMAYTFSLPNGAYKVNLYFAETWNGAFQPGARVFNVKLNGTVAIANLDVFAKVGANKADVETGNVTVSNGSLAILFEAVRENPIINAIEILPAGPAIPPQPDSITASGQLLWCAKCDGSDNVPAVGNLLISQTGAGDFSTPIAPDGTVKALGTIDVSQDPLEFTLSLTDANGAVQAGAALKLTFPKFEINSPSFVLGNIVLGIVRIAHTVKINDTDCPPPTGCPAVRIVDFGPFSLAK